LAVRFVLVRFGSMSASLSVVLY